MRYVQRDQPEGVPPLELTGERTLPDVPEENYWYRRHVAVYEWIAERCAGLDVVDLACGEGYGAELLARRAATVVGVDANPRPTSTPGCATGGPTSASTRTLVEDFDAPLRRRRLPADDRAHPRARPPARPDRPRSPPSPTSRPRTGSPSPAPDAEKSDNPWHLREYDIGEYRELLAPHFARVEVLGLFHARKLRAARARDPGAAGTACTGGSASPSRSTTASSPRSRPGTSACGPDGLEARARLRRGLQGEQQRVAAHEDRDRRRPGDRPPPPHALRRGLRHLPLRRGVAVRRVRALAPAGAGGRRAS